MPVIFSSFYCFIYIMKGQLYKIKLNVIQSETSAYMLNFISFHKGMKIYAV